MTLWPLLKPVAEENLSTTDSVEVNNIIENPHTLSYYHSPPNRLPEAKP